MLKYVWKKQKRKMEERLKDGFIGRSSQSILIYVGFMYPRSDTCKTCDLAVDNTEDEQKYIQLQTELATHQESAAKGYEFCNQIL